MISDKTKSIIERANAIYDQRLRDSLESSHIDRFVAIEPDSGEYFLGDTFDEAVKSARTKYPNRVSYTIRIGHPTAFRIGVLQS